ncbi:MAG: hypothetical protein AAFO94_05940, partial [Bacteroidota bacterium]
MKLFLTFKQWALLLGCSLMIQWQAMALTNTQVTGQITNARNGDQLSIVVNHRYLDQDVSTYRAELRSDGKYSIELELNEAQYVRLQFNGQQQVIYLEPSEPIRINFNGQNFRYTLQFFGKYADNNNLLAQY